jgi:hypothetical protein
MSKTTKDLSFVEQLEILLDEQAPDEFLWACQCAAILSKESQRLAVHCDNCDDDVKRLAISESSPLSPLACSRLRERLTHPSRNPLAVWDCGCMSILSDGPVWACCEQCGERFAVSHVTHGVSGHKRKMA